MNPIPNPSLSVLGKKIAISTAVQYAGKFIQMILSAIMLKLIANYLSKGQYGVYGAVTEYALFFSVVANLGIFAHLVRKMADDPLNGKVFANALLLRMMSAGVFFVTAFVILLFTGANHVFLVCSLFFIGSLFLDFMTSVCDGMLQANYMMGRATFALVVGKLVSFAGVWVVVRKFGEHLDAGENFSYFPMVLQFIFFALMLGSLVTAILSLWFVRQKIQWQWRIDWAFMEKILLAGIPFGVINILNNLYFRFLPDYYALRALNPEAFATFTISFRVAQVISLISTFLMFSALPGLKEYIDGQQFEKARALYRKIWKILAATGAVVIIGGSLFGPQILELLTHKKYFIPEFWFVLPMMLVLAAISYGYDVVLIILFAFEEDIWFLKREFLALFSAMVFFGGSFLVTNVLWKLFFIVMGAIVGEALMVILGSLKVKKRFQENLRKTSP